jgi:hypothetical protein
MNKIISKVLENHSIIDALITVKKLGIAPDELIELIGDLYITGNDGKLIIYGASDDLLELNGAIDDEIYAYNADKTIVLSDGTRLRFRWDNTYGFKIDLVNEGSCKVTIEKPDIVAEDADANGHTAIIDGKINWLFVTNTY